MNGLGQMVLRLMHLIQVFLAITTADAGNYYAVIQSGACPILTNEVALLVNPKPETPNLIIEDTQKCEGEAVQLTVTKPTVFPELSTVSYEWFTVDSDISLATTTIPNFTQTDLNATNSGALYAIVTQDGCISEVSNKVVLEVNTIPNEIAFIIENVSNTCNENEVKIEAIQPMLGIGEWTTNADLAIVDPLNPSTFLIDVPNGTNTIYWSLSY